MITIRVSKLNSGYVASIERLNKRSCGNTEIEAIGGLIRTFGSLIGIDFEIDSEISWVVVAFEANTGTPHYLQKAPEYNYLYQFVTDKRFATAFTEKQAIELSQYTSINKLASEIDCYSPQATNNTRMA